MKGFFFKGVSVKGTMKWSSSARILLVTYYYTYKRTAPDINKLSTFLYQNTDKIEFKLILVFTESKVHSILTWQDRYSQSAREKPVSHCCNLSFHILLSNIHRSLNNGHKRLHQHSDPVSVTAPPAQGKIRCYNLSPHFLFKKINKTSHINGIKDSFSLEHLKTCRTKYQKEKCFGYHFKYDKVIITC